MQLSRYQYQLEHTLASIQPVQDRPPNDMCDGFGITPWPELKLYSGDNGRVVQPLKPHQVDGKLSPICKLRARPRGTVWDASNIVSLGLDGYRHTFLSNDMGTGKTKTYFTAIELNNRQKRKSRQQDIDTKGQSDVEFPSWCRRNWLPGA
ncbi:hypothetical protein NW752_004311 [Fusarium irregulare]|uniref:SNF2 N-terminal domain-containing protein n=1 Tax=Fusarium irregulare TaxID=2494466 RepID=A0A9W8U7V2_9HYPO|nr:hypothetical protein NW766_007215 [Fusarium irregulare]KAJ4021304.1 hypothetical protein NW752_004311 [Fusarium irregulare]